MMKIEAKSHQFGSPANLICVSRSIDLKQSPCGPQRGDGKIHEGRYQIRQSRGPGKSHQVEIDSIKSVRKKRGREKVLCRACGRVLT